MKSTAFAVALVIQVGMTGLSQAGTYIWKRLPWRDAE